MGWPIAPSLGPVVLSPTGTSADVANLRAAITSAAGKRSIYLRGGTYTIGADEIDLSAASSTHLDLAPGARLLFSLPHDGGNPTYNGIKAVAPADLSVTSTTIHTTPTWGSVTLVTDGSVAAGKWIRLTSASWASTVQVVQVAAVSGSGPTYTLTLASPLRYDFAATDTIDGVIPPHDIALEGGEISGTGSWAMLFYSCVRVAVRGVRFTATSTDEGWDGGAVVSDYGSVGAVLAGLVVENATGTHGGGGIALAGTVDGAIRGGRIVGAKTFGVSVEHCRGAAVTGTQIGNVIGTGLIVQTSVPGGGADNTGSTETAISDVSVAGCTADGVKVTDGSDVALSGVSSRANGGNGFALLVGTAGPTVRMTNCDATDNAFSGYGVNQVAYASLSGCAAGGNGSGGAGAYADLLVASSIVQVSDFSSASPRSTAAILLTGTADLTASNVRLAQTRHQLTLFVRANGASVVGRFTGLRFTGATGQNHQAIRNDDYESFVPGTIHLSHVSYSGVDSVGYISTTGGVLLRGEDVDLPSISGGTITSSTAP